MIGTMFETFIIQPVYNLLLTLYALFGDFGLAIILFTVVIRLLMWPLLKKQLHQGKMMRKLQPEIKEIRAKNKGNNQKQSQELMDLYKRHGVNPIGSFGLLFVQIPVFLGLFAALRSIIENPERIINLPYSFIESNARVQEMHVSVANKTQSAIEGLSDTELQSQLLEQFNGTVTVEQLESLSKLELQQLYSTDLVSVVDGVNQALVQGPFFNQELFGLIDLSGSAFSDGTVYIPVLIIAVLAGVFQFFQTRQLLPSNDKDSKSIKQIMSEAAKDGREPEQSEISAAMNKKLGLFFAPLITIISATSPSGLALYFASSGLVALIQQKIVLRDDLEEMELVADVVEEEDKIMNTSTKTKKTTAKKKSKKGTSSKSKKKKR